MVQCFKMMIHTVLFFNAESVHLIWEDSYFSQTHRSSSNCDHSRGSELYPKARHHSRISRLRRSFAKTTGTYLWWFSLAALISCYLIWIQLRCNICANAKTKTASIEVLVWCLVFNCRQDFAALGKRKGVILQRNNTRVHSADVGVQWLSSDEMDTATRVQIRDETLRISHSALRKVWLRMVLFPH